MRPYLLMAVLYITMAVLAALDAALINLSIVPMHSGIRWLRIHFITLGVLTQAIFGLMPVLVAAWANRPRPSIRWDIWATLNGGLIVLLVGIPLVNQVLIFTGGTLIFVATLLLLKQLNDLRPEHVAVGANGGRKFYIAGLSYLLLGIIVGTGLWLGWSGPLRIQVPLEVHIHANNWGFMALVFAGLLVDLYPSFTDRDFAWPNSVTPIFWMMTIGALGLVLGPWFQNNWFSVPGLILHLAATVWLLLDVIVPIWGDRQAWTPGMWHIISSYAWFLAPVLVAPLIVFNVPGFPGAGIEQNAPQALIYGWVLHFGYALVPYLLRRAFLPDEPAHLGGNWWSLITVHIGGVFLWASIFLTAYQAPLQGVAYMFWVISAVPIVRDVWHIVRTGLARLESDGQGLSPVDMGLAD